MRTPTILRSLPFHPIKATGAVVPLPEKTRFDRELTVELETLRSQNGGEIGLLEAAITTQKIALDSLVKISRIDDAQRCDVDKYLEDNVEILDACNYFVEKMYNIHKYVDMLKVVVHLLDNNNNSATSANVATTRASELLESCHVVERKMRKESNNNSGSCLKKLLREKLFHHATDLSEAMCGSKAMALICCRFVELGLSFDSKKGSLSTMKQCSDKPMSSEWLRLLAKMQKRSSLSLLLSDKLQKTVAAARELKELVKGKREKEIMKSAVESLKTSCMELEDLLLITEERVKDLYKSLIDVRMTLMGILSQA